MRIVLLLLLAIAGWSVDGNIGLGPPPATATSVGLGPTDTPTWSKATLSADTLELTLGTTNPTTVTRATQTGTRTFTLPDANSNPVVPASASANQWMTGISSAGVLSFSQPAFSNLSGTATQAQMPGYWKLLGSDCAQRSHTGDTTDTVVSTISINATTNPIPANAVIVVHALWTYTNSANTKHFRIRIGAAGAGTGGTLMKDVTATTTATLSSDAIIFVRSTSSEIAEIAGQVDHEVTSASAPATAAINLASNWEIADTVACGAAGETVTSEAISVYAAAP